MIPTGTPPAAFDHGGMRFLRWRGAGIPGSPLVLVHGLGDGADIWGPVLRAMPSGPMAAVAPDLPGHGGSDWLPPRHYSMPVLSDAVARGLEREAIRRPVLIGHSLGARVALELAAEGRITVDRLVLIDMNPDPAETVGDAVSEHLDVLLAGAPDEQGFVDQIAKRMHMGNKEVLSEVMPLLAKAKGSSDGPGMRLPFDPEIKRLLNAPAQSDGWAHLAALNCPLTIIRGEYSSALDAKTADKMASLTRTRSRVLTIPSAGHAIALEQPKALAAALHRAVTSKAAQAI